MIVGKASSAAAKRGRGATEDATAAAATDSTAYTPADEVPARTLSVLGPRSLTEGGFVVVRLPRWSYRVPCAPGSLEAAPTALYARSLTDHALYELQFARRSADVCGSWIFPGAVVADGRMLVATPISPLLVLLPLLQTARFVEAEELLPLPLLEACFGAPTDAAGGRDAWLDRVAAALGVLCDTDDVGGTRVYRPSPERMLAWLVARVDALCASEAAVAALRRATGGLYRTCATGCVDEALLRQRGEAAPAAASAADPSEARREALGVLAEYVPADWLGKVAAAVGAPGFVVSTATPPLAPQTVAAAEAKSTTSKYHKGSSSSTGGGGGWQKKGGAGGGAKKNAPAVAKGRASIASFFAPVSK